MTLPSLPAQGSTNWYAWAQAIDARVRVGGGGSGTPVADPTDPDLYTIAGSSLTADPTDPDLYIFA